MNHTIPIVYLGQRTMSSVDWHVFVMSFEIV
jgi:hypothetical protein